MEIIKNINNKYNALNLLKRKNIDALLNIKSQRNIFIQNKVLFMKMPFHYYTLHLTNYFVKNFLIIFKYIVIISQNKYITNYLNFYTRKNVLNIIKKLNNNNYCNNELHSKIIINLLKYLLKNIKINNPNYIPPKNKIKIIKTKKLSKELKNLKLKKNYYYH